MIREAPDRFRADIPDNEMRAERSLWCAFLLAMIEDAILGAPAVIGDKTSRIVETKTARAYFQTSNPHLALICEMLGLDADFVCGRVAVMIEAAPSPEELVKGRRTSWGGGPGLSHDSRDRRGEAHTRQTENRVSEVSQ